VLPTTPFLLLAAACYIRGSERFYNWLINHKWFGKYIRNWREKKGIPVKIKIIAIAYLWIAILIAIIFFLHILVAQIVLVVIASIVTLHILSMKTLRD
jgi:uncharacterized membrane protein YbaN (DUF454 family)